MRQNSIYHVDITVFEHIYTYDCDDGLYAHEKNSRVKITENTPKYTNGPLQKQLCKIHKNIDFFITLRELSK